MRPPRLVVGEVRAEECLDLLLVLNAGLPGMASLHANSAREALVKMSRLPLPAGENIGLTLWPFFAGSTRRQGWRGRCALRRGSTKRFLHPGTGPTGD